MKKRARAFKIYTNIQKDPTYRRRAPPRPLPLRSVPPVYIYRERCARQRKFILLVVKTEREDGRKIYEFCNNPKIKSCGFCVRVFAGRTTEINIETRIYIPCGRSKSIFESKFFVPRPRFLPLSRWPFFTRKGVLCNEKRAYL
jgi:hypothetical protein